MNRLYNKSLQRMAAAGAEIGVRGRDGGAAVGAELRLEGRSRSGFGFVTAMTNDKDRHENQQQESAGTKENPHKRVGAFYLLSTAALAGV